MPSPTPDFPNDAAAEAFASATLSIVPQHQNKRTTHFSSSSASASSPYKTCAYYRDSSGRARVHLKVRLEVPRLGGEGGDDDDDDGLSVPGGGIEALLECGCIRPSPVEEDCLGNSADGSAAQDDNDGENASDNPRKENEQDEEDEDDPWKKELSTIGKEVGSNDPWKTETTCSFECSIVCNEEHSTNNNNNRNSNSDNHGDASSAATYDTEDEMNPDRSKAWAVEGVTILQSQIVRSSPGNPKSPIAALIFHVEIAVCGSGIIRKGVKETLEEGELALCAVLRQRRKFVGEENRTAGNAAAKSLLDGGTPGAGVAAGLLGLELGGGALSPSVFRHPRPAFAARGPIHRPPANDDFHAPTVPANLLQKNRLEMHYGTKILRTAPPLRIRAKLIPPLRLSVREVCGARAASGSTLVEITVEHSSEWHDEPVTLTGIAFHPGQSRLWTGIGESRSGDASNSHPATDDEYPESALPMAALRPAKGKSMRGGELSVMDMSRRVRWGFAAGTAPELPLVLGPHEALATVIQIDAGEDVRSRAFWSPISANAVVGGGERVMVATDARWTTSRVAVENSDAFRVDMSLRGGLSTVCRVGAPLVVSLRVLNLSMEPRDLMLLMAKDGEGRNNGGLQWEQRPLRGQRIRTRRGSFYANVMGGTMLHNRAHLLEERMNGAPPKENHSFNTAVVSEVNGYTFGVWGLSGDDDGTTRHHRDHELLAVDAALLLGEVKGQHSIEAELRFVPLREGTLNVPNLKIYDKRGGRWYNCVHTLKIVAAAKA